MENDKSKKWEDFINEMTSKKSSKLCIIMKENPKAKAKKVIEKMEIPNGFHVIITDEPGFKMDEDLFHNVFYNGRHSNCVVFK